MSRAHNSAYAAPIPDDVLHLLIALVSAADGTAPAHPLSVCVLGNIFVIKLAHERLSNTCIVVAELH
jgi:hypothetical protein